MSHSDFDHKGIGELASILKDAKPVSGDDLFAQLTARAERLTERGENRITAGAPDEPVLAEAREGGVHLRKLPDDPACLRISIGRTTFEPPRNGTYCTYRGSRAEVLALLEHALAALRGTNLP